MANKKLTELPELTTTPAADDFLYIVDKSDLTESGDGTSKKIRVDKLPTGGTVDPTIIEDSPNAVAGGAVFDGLALKVDKVTGKSLISDTEITRLAGVSNTNLITETFTFSASQSFVLTNDVLNIVSVVVNMSSLHPSQYTLVAPKTITINNTLDSGDEVSITYNYIGVVELLPLSQNFVNSPQTVLVYENSPIAINRDWRFVTSVFSGWGYPIGVVPTFNKLVFKTRARATPITSIQIYIKENDYSGAVLYTEDLVVSIPANTEQDITVTLPTPITNINPLFFTYACNQLCDLWSDDVNLDYPIPPSRYYSDSGNFGFMSSAGSATVVSPMEFYNDIPEYYIPTPQLISEINKANISSEILLPETIFATVGVEMNIYYDNIIFSNVNIKDLELDITCTKGKQMQDWYRYTPVSGDVGTTTLKIDVYYLTQLITSKTVNLKTTATATGSARSIICVGDSLTEAGTYISTINTDYGSDALDLTFKGIMGTAPNKSEGRGGYSLSTYCSAGYTLYKFILSGVTTPPVAYSEYTNNGSTFTVSEVNITAGSGYISCYKQSGVNDPTASGTLTKTVGVGDATLSFSSWSTVPGNPFWIGGALNMSDYLTNNSITMATNDYINIMLGVNDVFSIETDEDLVTFATTSYIPNMETFIYAWKDAVPLLKFSVCLTNLPSKSQDAFGNNYSNTQNTRRFKRNVQMLNKYVLEHFDTTVFRAANVFINPLNANLDTVNNMNAALVAYNARNSATYLQQNNGVHPATIGYDQIADGLFATLKGLE